MSDASENTPCLLCEGKGFRDVKRVCSRCGGSGKVRMIEAPFSPTGYQKCTSCEGFPVSMVKETCSACGGTGYLESRYITCSSCDGKGEMEISGYYIGDRYVQGLVWKCPLCKGKGRFRII